LKKKNDDQTAPHRFEVLRFVDFRISEFIDECGFSWKYNNKQPNTREPMPGFDM
jgi:hypothetical protein